MTETLIESAVPPFTADSEEGAEPEPATGSPSSPSWRRAVINALTSRTGCPTPEHVRSDGHRTGCPF